MVMRKATIGCMLVFALSVAAQSTDFEKFREQQRASFSQFRDNQQDKYDAFRQRVNAEYAEFMRAAWAEFPVSEAEVPEPEARTRAESGAGDLRRGRRRSKVKSQRSKV